MRFIDLFAGIGGFRSGLESSGHKCVGYVERDKFARKSYQAIYNTKGEYTAYDIQEIKGTDFPDAGLWTFGSPCTNISVAGKRTGLKGTESRMFFEVIRLLEERIRNQQTLPPYLLMENVKNLLSSNGGRDFAEVVYQMDQVGYDVEWNVFDSADVVPQHRERVYIVGHLRGASTHKVFPIIRENKNLVKTAKIKRLINGRKNGGYGSNDVYKVDGASPTLNTMTGGNRQPKILVVGNTSKTGYRSHDIVDENGISKTVDATSYKHKPQVLIRAAITPDRLNKRQNGRRFKNNGEPAFTLTAQDRHGILLDEQKDDNSDFWYHGKAIRKLTPRECWRLQGFNDEQFEKAKEAGISNSQLYKQAGNAVTVPIVKAIGEKIPKNM